MDNCIFCKISVGEVPSYKIYEDDFTLAFLDINPDCIGHTLVIPKKHYTNILDIDNNTLNKIFDAARLIANKLTEKLSCDGFTLVQNNGDIQEVKHFHLHIKPYYNNKQDILSAEEIYKTLNN